MSPARVMVISDDEETIALTTHLLNRRGWEVATRKDGRDALSLIEGSSVDLALVHLNKSPNEVIELCRRLRSHIVNPILVLSSHHDEAHILDVYRSGADECISSPFSYSILMAKIAAWLRHSWNVTTESLNVFTVGELEIDPSKRTVRRGEHGEHSLSNLEFRLLLLLIAHRDRPLPADFIIKRVWRSSVDGDNVTLKNVIYRLRRKVEATPSRPRYIRIVRGQGYLFVVPAEGNGPWRHRTEPYAKSQ